MMDDKQIKDFNEWGVTPPSTVTHGSDLNIQDSMKKLLPNSWKLEGNQLIGQTDMGELRQTIPTSHILVGSDPRGLPIFRKIDL